MAVAHVGRGALWELPWFFVAGPLPSRAGSATTGDELRHVEHPHDYVWFIGVHPDQQGHGVGRALMAELHD